MLHLFAPSSILDSGDRFTRDMLIAGAMLFAVGMGSGLHAVRPTSLELAVAVEAAPDGTWVRAALQPTSFAGSHGSETCILQQGRCELWFEWSRKHGPWWPSRHMLEIAVADGDAWKVLGTAPVTSPSSSPVSVRCPVNDECRAAP